MPSIADRLETWWRERRRRKQWARLTPEQQMAVWAKAINDNPRLRELFQQCLRVKGFDRTVRGPR